MSRDAVHVAGQVADAVEFFYGDPDRDLVVLAEQKGATVGWQTGSVREAAAEDVGCDYVSYKASKLAVISVGHPFERGVSSWAMLARRI